MRKGDLADVCRIAAICHPDFPEDDAVLAEKYTLSPDTCFILDRENKSVGYILAHPFKIGAIPPLNCLLGSLPRQSDTLYIHDLALLQQARSGGFGKKAVEIMCECAKRENFDTLSLVAVNGSLPFWQRNGFHPIEVSPQLKQKLLTYDEDARYMIHEGR